MNLIDTVQTCLEHMQLPATRVPNLPVVNLPVEIENGKLNIFIHAHEDAARVFVYARPQDMLVPIERIPAVAEFLTRANYGLPLGNWEIDMNDGEMNFKNSVDVSGGELTEGMVKTLLVFAMECANRYLPGIRTVIDGSAAKTALEAIDGPTKVVIK